MLTKEEKCRKTNNLGKITCNKNGLSLSHRQISEQKTSDKTKLYKYQRVQIKKLLCYVTAKWIIYKLLLSFDYQITMVKCINCVVMDMIF